MSDVETSTEAVEATIDGMDPVISKEQLIKWMEDDHTVTLDHKDEMDLAQCALIAVEAGLPMLRAVAAQRDTLQEHYQERNKWRSRMGLHTECDVDSLTAELAALRERETQWKELTTLYRKAISDLSGLHIAHGATQLGSDEDVAEGKRLREALGIGEQRGGG